MISGLLFRKTNKQSTDEIKDPRIAELDARIESELSGVSHIEHGILNDTITERNFDSQGDFLDWANNVADLILERLQISIGVDIHDSD